MRATGVEMRMHQSINNLLFWFKLNNENFSTSVYIEKYLTMWKKTQNILKVVIDKFTVNKQH